MVSKRTQTAESTATGTRAALIATAERLFAERGVEGVSLRDVQTAAGQGNQSAVQYHFGDRMGLVAAVFERRLEHIEANRRAIVERMTPRDRTDLRSVVWVAVAPLCEAVAGPQSWFARFLARCLWDDFEFVQSDGSRSMHPAFGGSLDMIAECLPSMPPQLHQQRFHQFIALVIGTLGRWEGMAESDPRRLSLDDVKFELVSTAIAVLLAPPVTPN